MNQKELLVTPKNKPTREFEINFQIKKIDGTFTWQTRLIPAKTVDEAATKLLYEASLRGNIIFGIRIN